MDFMDYLERAIYNRYRWDVISVGKEDNSEATMIINLYRQSDVKLAFERIGTRDKYINSIRGTKEYSIYLDYFKGLRKGFNRWFGEHWETETVKSAEYEYMEDVKVRTQAINYYLDCGDIVRQDVDPCANLYVDKRHLLNSYRTMDLYQTLYANDRLTDTDINAMHEMMTGLSIWLKCCGYSDYEALEIIRGRFVMSEVIAEWYYKYGYIWYSKVGCAYVVKLALGDRATKKWGYGIVVDYYRGVSSMTRFVPIITVEADRMAEILAEYEDAVKTIRKF